MIAVVPGYAAPVDLEADARVRVDPGLQIRDADGDVIDALKNGRAYSDCGVARRLGSGLCDQRELVGVADGFDGQIVRSGTGLRIVPPSSSWPPPVEPAQDST